MNSNQKLYRIKTVSIPDKGGRRTDTQYRELTHGELQSTVANLKASNYYDEITVWEIVVEKEQLLRLLRKEWIGV